MPRRCAFLTQDTITRDDDLAAGPLKTLGYQVEPLPWRRRDVDWRQYDIVVIRSAWDYHLSPDEFLAVLSSIDAGTRLENPLELVRWNTPKTYLRHLAALGIPIVPTVWRDRLHQDGIHALFDEVGSADIVIKPVIGASSHGSFRLHSEGDAHQVAEVETFFHDTPLMAQPTVPTVFSDGEYSLFYFDGEYSHAVAKSAKPGDYRVQEEYGGLTRSITAGQELLEAGRAALDALDDTPLYARVDLLRANQEPGYWLMELELIEPVLYLGLDRQAPARFAAAIAGSHDRGPGPVR